MMPLTKHAEIRSKQRGIPPEIIDLILAYGKSAKRPGGAWEFQLLGREKVALVSHLRHLIQAIDRSRGKAVLLSGEGDVITVYHLAR